MTDEKTTAGMTGRELGGAALALFAWTVALGFGYGVASGVWQIFHSAALVYGLKRLALETLARETADSMRWGAMWGFVLAVYGALAMRLTGAVRRGLLALGFALVAWLAGLGGVVLYLSRNYDTNLPLPYRQLMTFWNFLSRWLWPVIANWALVTPLRVLFAWLVSMAPAFALGGGLFWLLRRKLPAAPFRRIPSLAFSRRTGAVFAAVAALAVVVVAVPRALGRPAGKPNVLLVSMDTVRHDGLHCYGNPRATSPIIDSLAQNGVRYENVYANAPWTLPSHVTMFSGLIPDVHGTHQLDFSVPREAPLLAESFKNAGYDTFAMTSIYLVSPFYGFNRGFDRFLFRPEVKAPVVAQGVLSLLPRVKQPWFGFVHFYDAHLPYQPSDESRHALGVAGPRVAKVRGEMANIVYDYVEKYLAYPPEDKAIVRALYDGAILDVDRAIGRILAEVKKRFGLDNTIVIITADHGEEFGEHGWQGHSVALHEESLRIPLIIAGKNVPRGEVRSALTSLTMLAPQILALAGLPDPLQRDWRQIEAEPVAYAHTAIFGPARYSFRVPGWSLVTANEYKFGDNPISRPPGLYADRLEQTNLLADQPEKAAEMQAAMEHYVGAQIKAYGAMKAGALELDPARLQKMKELGYVN